MVGKCFPSYRVSTANDIASRLMICAEWMTPPCIFPRGQRPKNLPRNAYQSSSFSASSLTTGTGCITLRNAPLKATTTCLSCSSIQDFSWYQVIRNQLSPLTPLLYFDSLRRPHVRQFGALSVHRLVYS